MANLTTNLLETLGHKVTAVTVDFDTNAASNPVSPKGYRYTVTHTGTGQYTVVFQDNWLDCWFKTAHLQINAAANSIAQINSFTVTAAVYNGQAVNIITGVVITTLTAGAAADIAANANNRVSALFLMKNSTLR